MMHGGDRWAERARNDMTITHDHREPWDKGPDPEVQANKKVGEWEERAQAVLLKYLAMHGDWQEITSHTPRGATQSWDFKVCECVVCQEAAKLVGHPGTPNG